MPDSQDAHSVSWEPRGGDVPALDRQVLPTAAWPSEESELEQTEPAMSFTPGDRRVHCYLTYAMACGVVFFQHDIVLTSWFLKFILE